MADGRALFDDAVRRRIALERYSSAQIKKTLAFLKEVEADLIGKIAGMRGATTRTQRLTLAGQERLLASVRSIHAEAYEKLNETLRKDMVGLAGAEGRRAGVALSKAASSANLGFRTNELTATAAFEIAAAKPMQGYLLQDWLDDLEPSHRRRIDAALRISFAEGESLETAMNRLRGAVSMNERGLAALIRTSNSHIATSVTEATYEANADILEGVEWVSILDGRTTEICRARDGKRWPVGEGPRPPAHIGCRSTVIPVLIGQDTPERELYPDWLKRQPAKVQDDILGPARGKLFRSGSMNVDRFVDMRGKALTLDDLGASRGGVPFEKNPLGLLGQAARGDITVDAMRRELEKYVEQTSMVRRLGMTDKERLSRIRIGDVDLWMPPDLPLTPAQVRDLNAVLTNTSPAAVEVRSATNRITLAASRSADDAYWAEEMDWPDFETAASAYRGEMVFYGKTRMDAGTLSHEMGHNWAEKIFGSNEIPTNSPFAKLVASGVEPPVSLYASQNVDEDWAETIRLLVTDPDRLRLIAPKRFDIVSRLVRR